MDCLDKIYNWIQNIPQILFFILKRNDLSDVGKLFDQYICGNMTVIVISHR